MRRLGLGSRWKEILLWHEWRDQWSTIPLKKYTHTLTHLQEHTCTHAHTHTNMNTHMHTPSAAYIHAHTRTYTHAHTLTHIHTPSHTSTHPHTHTHTQWNKCSSSVFYWKCGFAASGLNDQITVLIWTTTHNDTCSSISLLSTVYEANWYLYTYISVCFIHNW